MTVAVISYRQTENDGEDLRYCLRSIERNLLDLSGVVLAGDRPSWFLGEHVDGVQSLGKTQNVARTVLAGVRRARALGYERVLYLADDYFLMEPQAEVVQGHRGPLERHLAQTERGMGKTWWYSISLRNTFDFLKAYPGAFSWELHRPLWLDTEKAERILTVIAESGHDVFWRTVYATMAGEVGYEMRDGRLETPLPLGVSWLSSDERSWPTPTGNRIRRMFSTPSMWEDA